MKTQAAEPTFSERVAQVVRGIPVGTTMSYGQVAMLAGRPGAPRAAVRALGASEGLPWWRVIRSDGTMAEQVAEAQGKKLRAEGLRVVGRRVHPPEAVAEPKPPAKKKPVARKR